MAEGKNGLIYQIVERKIDLTPKVIKITMTRLAITIYSSKLRTRLFNFLFNKLFKIISNFNCFAFTTIFNLCGSILMKKMKRKEVFWKKDLTLNNC